MTDDLLPYNASDLECALASLSLRVEKLPVLNADIYNASICPTRFLPWLAWAFSVDVWCDEWDEATQRRMIESSLLIHKKKGTRAAVLKVLEVLNITATLEEWWQVIPTQTPHTFAVNIDANATRTQTTLTPALYPVLNDLIDRSKPARSHYHMTLKTKLQTPITLGLNIRAVTYCRKLCITQRTVPALQTRLPVGLLLKVITRVH